MASGAARDAGRTISRGARGHKLQSTAHSGSSLGPARAPRRDQIQLCAWGLAPPPLPPLTLMSLSPPAVARNPLGWKSTENTGSFSCHTICSVLAFIPWNGAPRVQMSGSLHRPAEFTLLRILTSTGRPQTIWQAPAPQKGQPGWLHAVPPATGQAQRRSPQHDAGRAHANGWVGGWSGEEASRAKSARYMYKIMLALVPGRHYSA